MIVFNEGLPRSGKSYDTILNHVLPALREGRRVFARLNGLDDPVRRTAICDFLNVDAAFLDQHLVHVSSAEVKARFRAEKSDGGEWEIPLPLRDSLCVIDECHSFYVASTAPIDASIEEFFALIGQNGGGRGVHVSVLQAAAFQSAPSG